MIERSEYMSILRRWRDKRVIKIVTGIRRCGKSSLLRMFQEHLIQSGVSDSQVQAINFEDIDNEPFLDYHTLYSHVKSHLQEGQMNYLFFDEIQMVPNFQKVINSLFLLDNVDIYVTGSNAYLLSAKLRRCSLADILRYTCCRFPSANTSRHSQLLSVQKKPIVNT